MTRPAYFHCAGDVFANGSPCIHMTPADVEAELAALHDEIAVANNRQDFAAGLDAGRRAAQLSNARGACEQYHALLSRCRSDAMCAEQDNVVSIRSRMREAPRLYAVGSEGGAA